MNFLALVCILKNKLCTMKKFCRKKINIELPKQPSHKYEFNVFHRNSFQSSVILSSPHCVM